MHPTCLPLSSCVFCNMRNSVLELQCWLRRKQVPLSWDNRMPALTPSSHQLTWIREDTCERIMILPSNGFGITDLSELSNFSDFQIVIESKTEITTFTYPVVRFCVFVLLGLSLIVCSIKIHWSYKYRSMCNVLYGYYRNPFYCCRWVFIQCEE